MQGKTVNGFTLQRLLGVGGMAEVWYAENRIKKKAAVKMLLPRLCIDEGLVSRFQNEAEVMVELEHPNIRQVYDYGEIDGRPAIVMEYLEGEDLKTLMKQDHSFSDDQLQRWWNQMVDALNYTHALGIVHRDIKPSNIFIDRKGDVRLLDFGIAKNNDGGSGTLTGSTLGTRIYMSPEQVRDPKRVDYRTDLYSLAVTFVHLISGKAPYDSTANSDYDIQVSIVTKPLDLSMLPAAWRDFLKPYLEKKPEDRPALKKFAVKTVENQDDNSKTEFFPSHRMVPRIGEKTWVEDNSSQTITFNGVSFVMRRVDGGVFWMGAHNNYVKKGFFDKEPDHSVPNFDACAEDDEGPVHQVKLNTFYMLDTPVTQALWEAVMGYNNSGWKGLDLPVDSVSWFNCQEFILKLDRLTGKNFRLPTEAEWEFAARGGVKSKGYRYAGSDDYGAVAWYAGNSENKTHAVKKKRPNELGLYDMSGNVCEWCDDWKGNYRTSDMLSPQGAAYGSVRILRGGCWFSMERNCRVSRRFYDDPAISKNYYGFRIVFSV